MNSHPLTLVAALALSLGAAGLAQAADPAQAAPAPTAASAVGHWLRDPQGRIIGSVRSLSPDGQTAQIMVGAYFQEGSHLATIPADALSVTNGRVTLRTDTAVALNAAPRCRGPRRRAPGGDRGAGLRQAGCPLAKGPLMQDLLPKAERLGALLKARRETVGVAESSSGGLVAAALLSVPGASAYFQGGAVVYTQDTRTALLAITPEGMAGIRSASEPYALLLARTMRERLGTTWGIAETGAAGPDGNRYGDAPGHTCIAVSGPVERVATVETGHGDRVANMRAFAAALLDLLTGVLS